MIDLDAAGLGTADVSRVWSVRPGTNIAVLRWMTSEKDLVECIKAGALGYFPKELSAPALAACQGSPNFPHFDRLEAHTPPGASCPRPAKQQHSAREQLVELARINYPFHPRAGLEVEVLGRMRLRTDDFLIVRQPDGTRAQIPLWMTLPWSTTAPVERSARLSLTSLQALRHQLNAALSSSTTVQPTGGDDEGLCRAWKSGFLGLASF